MSGQNELPVEVRLGIVDELSAKMEKIKNKFPELSKKVSEATGRFNFLQESTKGFRKQVEDFSKAVVPKLESVGKAMTVGITLPVVAAAGYSVHKFMEIEDALNDVQGATDLSGASLKEFGDTIGKMSVNTTFSQEELLKLASAAGEAGVRGGDNLAKFSIALAQLGKTANIAGPEAAESIFKILTLTKEGVGSVGNFGSAITALENQYGVKASKILESTAAITREVAKFGLSSTQIAGLATAIAPLGFEAKNASGAVAEAFRGIDDAIRNGGVKMIGLQKITGMTGDQLKKDFKDNPEKVFEAFLGGLNTLEQKGGKTAEALAFFGASGDKTGVILTTLAKDTKALAAVQAFAGAEYAKNTALTDEYKDTTTTLSASLKMFKNNTDALALSLGGQLAPIVKFAADAMGGLMAWFNQHPTIATFVAAIAGVLAIVGPMLLGIAEIVKTFQSLMVGLNMLSAAWTFLAGVEYAALLPYIAIGAAIIGLIAIIWIFRDAIMKGIVAAWDFVIEKIMQVIEIMKKVTGFLSQGILKFTPLGAMAYGANKLLNMVPSGATAGPQGPETGAAPTAADAATSQFATQTNNARVDINVRAPQSTQISSEQAGGFMSINRGQAGAF